ncbi:MAG TPA: hypothetical protein VGK81_03375 [Anaerolineae bacterium]
MSSSFGASRHRPVRMLGGAVNGDMHPMPRIRNPGLTRQAKHAEAR